MSNQFYPVQEDLENPQNYLHNGLTETQLNSQNYYQIKGSQEYSPQRNGIKSRLGDMSQTISQYSPERNQNQKPKQTITISFSPNRNQKAMQSLSPQKNQMNSFDRSQIESHLFNKSTQQSIQNPLQLVTTQARRIEELQIEVELLKQRECVQLSTEEKNQLISDLYTQIEQKNNLLQRQNEIISSLERQVLDGNARVRILEIDTEQYMIEIKQYKDELMLQNARNQSLQTSVNELRKTYDDVQSEKMHMGDQFRKQYSDAVEENLVLKNALSQLESKNNQLANELNNAMDSIISEKAKQELLKKDLTSAQQQQQQQQQQHQQQLSLHPIRKDSFGDETQNYNNVSASYNNQSFLLDDFHANTINISMTSENLSEKMKRYCAELDSFIEKFLENKKYRVRSKQEMKFFSEMAKMIQFLKNKHMRISDEFKEQVDMMNKKSDETRAHMISTLAHVRILKQSTELTITDLEKSIDDLKTTKERNLKKIDELEKKIKELDKEMTELKKKMNQQTVKIHELTELSNQRQSKIEEQDKNIKNLNLNIKNLNEQMEVEKQEFLKKEQQYNSQISQLNEQVSSLLNKQEQLNKQIEELQSELSNSNSENEELTQGLEILHQQKESEKNEYENTIQEHLINLSDRNKQIKEQLSHIQELENQIKVLCDNGDNQGQEVLRLNQIVKELQTKEYNLQEDVRTCKRKIASLESKQEDRQQVEEQVNELSEQNQNQIQEIEELRRKNQELESVFQELQDKSITSEQELSIIKEKIPLVDEEMKQLIDIKDKNLQQINQLKTLILQMESKILMHETKIQEQDEELEQKQVLIQMMKVELEQIDNLHQESLLHEKVFYVKKQEEYEKTIFNLIEENKQLKIQRQTLNTSINYLNKIDNFFENENQGYQDQKQQIQKQNKKIKVLVQELDTQLKEKSILEKRVSELETYINLIIENSVEYNSNNEKQIEDLKSALFNSKQHGSIKSPDYYLDEANTQTFNINLQSPNNQTNQSFSIQGNHHNTYDSNEIV